MENVRLSPSGDRYAFVADDGHGRRLYVITADNKPVTAANVGAQKLVGLEWAGEDLLVLYLSATVKLGLGCLLDKQELSGAVVLNVKTGAQTMIFGKSPIVAPSINGVYGLAHIAGRWLGYYGGDSLEGVAGSNGDRRYKNTDSVGGVDYINEDLYRVDSKLSGVSLLGLSYGGHCVYQHRVVLAEDQSRRERVKAQRFAERLWPLADHSLSRRGKNVDTQRAGRDRRGRAYGLIPSICAFHLEPPFDVGDNVCSARRITRRNATKPLDQRIDPKQRSGQDVGVRNG